MHSNGLRRFGLILTVWTVLAAAGCGGEYVVSGWGNGGNTFGTDVLERVAHELAVAEATPPVSDDDLRTAYAAIREHALQGDPEAALVLLLVAGEQRNVERE